MSVREQYYQKMFDYKYDIRYLEMYLDETVFYQRLWKIILAVASCSAVACWTAWTKFAYWWGFIIVAAELLSVVLDFIPYDYRRKELSKAIAMKNAIVTNMEHGWNEINIEKKQEKEINDKLQQINQKWDKAEKEVFKDTSLRPKIKLRDRAQDEVIAYMINYYGGEYGG